MKMKKKPNMTRLLILLVAAVLLIVYLSVPSVNAFITNAAAVLGSANVDAVIEYIRSFGAWAMVFSFCLMVFSSLIAPLPAFMITLSNAAIFGWWQGAILSWSSAMVGAALCFFVARGLGRDVVEKFAGKGALAGVENYFEKYGTKTILVCRLLPFVSFDAVSYFAGLTPHEVCPLLSGHRHRPDSRYHRLFLCGRHAHRRCPDYDDGTSVPVCHQHSGDHYQAALH